MNNNYNIDAMALDIINNAKEYNDNEVFYRSTLESLADHADSGVSFNPERVMQAVIRMSRQHGVTINRYM